MAGYEIKEEWIARLNHEVRRFQEAADLRFKARPIISWEFADKDDYINAQRALMIGMEFRYIEHKAVRRLPHRFELDYGGVTFRLKLLSVLDEVER